MDKLKQKELHLKRKKEGRCVDCGIKLSGWFPKDDDFFPLCRKCGFQIMKEMDE